MAMRDTPRERAFAKKSLPSAIALGPSEVVVGIDDSPAADDLAQYLRHLAGEYAGLRVIRVPVSSEWKFQLANVIWHCYKACRNDAVLAFDVDTVLRPCVAKGASLVGRDNVAVVSFTKRLLCRTVGDWIRYASYRDRVRHESYVFAGIYWVWRPYYFDSVDREGLSRIVNGIDAYMTYAIHREGRYSVTTLKEIGVDCMDYENEFYTWRQFSDGVYWGVKSMSRSRAGRLVFMAHMLRQALMWNKMWMWRGYRWSMRNLDSDACRSAREAASADDWAMYGGSRYFADMDWDRHGTGF